MRIPADFLDRGCFAIPHVIYSPDLPLDKHERFLFTVLLAVEDEFLKTHSGTWFHATNRAIHERSGISLRQIPRIRERLRRKRMIIFRRGHTGQATEYRILLDNFYRFKAG